MEGQRHCYIKAQTGRKHQHSDNQTVCKQATRLARLSETTLLEVNNRKCQKYFQLYKKTFCMELQYVVS